MTSEPSIRIRPDVGSISRFTIFIVVVLPLPLVPSSTRVSPSRTSMERSFTASTPPGYVLQTCSNVINVAPPGYVLSTSKMPTSPWPQPRPCWRPVTRYRRA